MAYFANGTEARIFEDEVCSRCVHYDQEIGVDKPCPVWMAHQLYAYELCNETEHPGKVILDMLIPDVRPVASDGLIAGPAEDCAMFWPRDEGAKIKGQLTLVDQ